MGIPHSTVEAEEGPGLVGGMNRRLLLVSRTLWVAASEKRIEVKRRIVFIFW